jgi:hypothetical protein
MWSHSYLRVESSQSSSGKNAYKLTVSCLYWILLLFMLMEWDHVSDLPPSMGLLFISQVIYHYGAMAEHWQGKTERTRRKTFTGVTLYTTNPTCTKLGAIPGLDGERPAANRLRFITTASLLYFIWLNYIVYSTLSTQWTNYFRIKMLVVT